MNPHRVLRTGTYLHTYCPHCGADLIEGHRVRLAAVSPDGEQGQLQLSPRFNIFEKQSSFGLPRGAELAALHCPHCEASLIDAARRCRLCRARAAHLRIAAVDVEVLLYFCTRIGCRWHGLAPEHEREVELDAAEPGGPEEEPTSGADRS